MLLPTFIGIGSPRAGTTWLDDLLRSHPEIYLPQLRKEIDFFNLNYEKGMAWYGRFFPEDETANRYLAIGEISPHYLYSDKCPERIAEIRSVRNLIIQIRNPTDRAFSYYQMRIKNTNFPGTFRDFINSRPETLEEGFYSKHLKNYLKYFSRKQILVLIFEQMFENVEETKKTIAEYLGIDPGKFPSKAGSAKINQSYLPKARMAYSISHQIARFLRKYDLDSLVNLTKRIGIDRLFGEEKTNLHMDQDTKDYLLGIYRNEKSELEALLEIDLSCWDKDALPKSKQSGTQ